MLSKVFDISFAAQVVQFSSCYLNIKSTIIDEIMYFSNRNFQVCLSLNYLDNFIKKFTSMLLTVNNNREINNIISFRITNNYSLCFIFKHLPLNVISKLFVYEDTWLCCDISSQNLGKSKSFYFNEIYIGL